MALSQRFMNKVAFITGIVERDIKTAVSLDDLLHSLLHLVGAGKPCRLERKGSAGRLKKLG